MSLNAHYQDELSYLRELGQEFARANPKLAGFLAREANDPDVERLLEGFAFSVAACARSSTTRCRNSSTGSSGWSGPITSGRSRP